MDCAAMNRPIRILALPRAVPYQALREAIFVDRDRLQARAI
jgi:hypothetical protein